MAEQRTSDMDEVLRRQRAAHLMMRPEPIALRRDRIERAIRLLKDNSDALCQAMSEDFGNRSNYQSKLTDIDGTINFCLLYTSDAADE